MGKSTSLDSHGIQLTTPIMVCTVPKSGAHLMIGILESLFGETFVYKPPDYRNRLIHQQNVNITETDVLMNPNLENKFYVGHIQYSEPTHKIIKDIPKILLVRDPRDYLVSMSYYLDQSPGPSHAKYRELPTWDVKMSATIFGMRGGF